MSGSSQKDGRFSRRAVTIGGGIAAALGIAALGLSVPRWLGKHYAKSPYDDLFALLVDREAAVKIGKPAAVHLGDDPRYTARTLAAELRKRFKGHTLAQVTAADIADGRITEAEGWVMPTTVLMLCVLAASADA